MYLIKYTLPLTPPLRYKTKYIFFKQKKKLLNRIQINFASGRNNTGTIVCKKKGVRSRLFVNTLCTSEFRASDFLLLWTGVNFRTKNLFNYFCTHWGCFFNLPALRGLTVGTIIKGDVFVNAPYPYVQLSVPALLSYMPFFSKVSNLFFLNTKKFVYSTSSGTYCLKLRAEKKEKLIKVKLPSDEIKFFSRTTVCLLGENYQNNKNKIVTGKAGFNKNIGIRQSVRGVAMNPVDHPNGGRTKSCKPELSPWGWVAKKNK